MEDGRGYASSLMNSFNSSLFIKLVSTDKFQALGCGNLMPISTHDLHMHQPVHVYQGQFSDALCCLRLFFRFLPLCFLLQ